MTQHATPSGDARADAFALLVVPLLAQLIAFAKRRMTSPQDAEDVIQDACVRAWQGFSTLRDTSRAAPWLFRILRSVMADEYGTQGRRRELVSISRLEDVYEGLLASEDDPYANAVSRGAVYAVRQGAVSAVAWPNSGGGSILVGNASPLELDQLRS